MSSVSYILEKPLINNSEKKRHGDTVQRRAEGRHVGGGGVCLVPDTLTRVGFGVSVRGIFVCVCRKTSSDAHDNVGASGDEQQKPHEIRPGFVAGKLRRRLTLRAATELEHWKKSDM